MTGNWEVWTKARVRLLEIDNEGKDLIDTATESTLNEELLALQKRHKAELRQVRDEMEEAIRQNDKRAQSELAEVCAFKRQLDASGRNLENLREQNIKAARNRQQAEIQLEYLMRGFQHQKEKVENQTPEKELRGGVAGTEPKSSSPLRFSTLDFNPVIQAIAEGTVRLARLCVRNKMKG